MSVRHFTVTFTLLAMFGLATVSLVAGADQRQPAGETSSAESPTPKVSLFTRQEALELRYKQFIKTLRQMADYMRRADPERANLLYRVLNRSQETRVELQLEQVARLLEGNNPRFGEAIEGQEDLTVLLKALLVLLQSEDRMSEIDKEKKRIKQLLKDVNNLIGSEMDIRHDTARRGTLDGIAERQKKVANKTKKIGQNIKGQDAEKNGLPPGEDSSGKGKPGEGKPNKGKPGEGKPSDGKPGEGKPKKGKPGEGKPGEEKPGKGQPGKGKPGKGKPGKGKPGKGKPGKGKPGKGKPGKGKPGKGKPGKGKPGKGKPGKGKPGKGKPGEDKPDSAQNRYRTPGREELEQARQDMERAIEELKKKNREGASEEEEKALANLIRVKEKLEEILRQLREEERELILAALEARFKKMITLQIIVNNGTVALDKVARKEWSALHRGRARDLGIQEDQIAAEAARALVLLQEEGSSVAFPEAVSQLREDMLIVARRLERNQVADLTQGIELEIIDALSEIIEALQREIEKAKNKKKKKQQQQKGQQQNKKLVDTLAELKMLRTLQLRINRRTRRLGRRVRGEQASDPDVVTQLQILSRRQARIQQATYDLATGKNE